MLSIWVNLGCIVACVIFDLPIVYYVFPVLGLALNLMLEDNE